GEEAGGERADIGWLGDPLDGTADFGHGRAAARGPERPGSSRAPAGRVSRRLVSGGAPVVGLVHAPLLDRTYAARKGGGAFRDERRLHVSRRTPERAIVATGFPFRRTDLLDR